jgi:ribose transport system permease protein
MKRPRRIATIVQDPALPSVIMLVVLVIVNAALQPGFFSFQTFRLNFMTFTPLILTSLAQATLLLVGAVDLSLGAGISLVTTVMASLMMDSPLSIVAVTLLGIAVAIALSLFNGFFFGYIGPPPLITTFATSTIWYGAALLLMPSPGGHIPEAYYGLYSRSIGGFLPVPVLVLLVALGFCVFLGRLRSFRHLYAVGGNERAALASGIRVTRIKVFAFLVSSVFVALAALCVVAQTATGDARSGQGYTLNSVAAAVIGGIAFSGGKGNYLGAVCGGLILGLLINIIYFANITSFYQVFTRGSIILAALIIGALPRLRRELRGRAG